MDFDANLSFAGRALVVEASSPQGEALGASPWPAASGLREPSLVVGERLFGLLFPGDVRTLFERCRGALSVEGGSLRLRIRVRPEAKPVLKLQALPWEMVRDPSSKEFLALRHDVQIVRYLSLPTPVSAPLRLGSEPLDVLLAVASPRDLAPIACGEPSTHHTSSPSDP